jgi:hypothetical protein
LGMASETRMATFAAVLVVAPALAPKFSHSVRHDSPPTRKLTDPRKNVEYPNESHG